MAKIFVIDDDPGILDILRWTFQSAGHEVTTSSSPRKALDLALVGDFDAITIDAMMPKISGWELLETLRRDARTRDVPILMLTALGEVEDRVRGLRAGANDYLVKPFEPIELLARVELLISHYNEIRAAQRHDAEVEAEKSGDEFAATLLEITRRSEAGEAVEGLRLGRYEVIESLKAGPTGHVLRGFDPKLQRPVVLKTIPSEPDENRRERRIFHLLKEGAAGARFSHPNIVTVYDVVGKEGDAAFLAMEYVDGIDLRRRLATDPPLERGTILAIAAAVARALAAAHGNSLLHRDIKPSNVLLGRDGAIKVSDFGIAERTTRAVRPGQIAGTAGYIAPECLDGGGNTPASDLFSLGVVLYECFAGENPYGGETWEERAEKTRTVDPPPLRERCPDLAPEVCEMVDRLLRREPKERPWGAIEVAELFDRLVDERNLTFKPLAGVGSGIFELPREVDTPTLDLYIDETRDKTPGAET